MTVVTRSARPGIAARLGLVAVAAWLLVSPAPVGAADDVVRYGTPSVTATWGTGVEFRQPATLPAGVLRTELVISSPFDPFGSAVLPAEAPGTGPVTLVRTVGDEDLQLRPNTTLRGAWRVVLEDGSVRTGPSIAVTYRDTRFDWRSLTGATVRVHWYAGGDDFGKRALEIGERAIAQTSSLLGVRETDPVDFFIYAEQGAFYDALGPGTRENVGGQANPEIRTLFALITPDEIDADWVARVIPHELAHLVFDTAVTNPYHQPPTWLNEGLAVYLAQGYGVEDRAQVLASVAARTLMPLGALTGMFPTTRERFSLAYAESVAAIDFLVQTHGTDALVRLVRGYAAGVSDDEAFTRALGDDVARFEAAWLADLGARTPERYGPRPAASGPLPAAWGGPSASDGSVVVAAPAVPERGFPLAALVVGVVVAAVLVARRRRTRRPDHPGDLA